MTTQCSYQKWIVLGAGFLSYTLVAGLPYSMSVLYVEWRDEFQKSNSETALVQSLCIGFFLIMGFISGSLTSKFGSRKCGVISGIVTAFSAGVSFVAPSFTFLILSLGICLGTASSVNYVCATSAVSTHFEGGEKITALAVLTFGSGIGSSFFPYFLNFLNNIYGWRGTLLITASILLHIALLSYMYGDGNNRTKQHVKKYKNKMTENAKNGCISVIEPHQKEISQCNGSNLPKKGVNDNTVNKKNVSVLVTFKEVLYNKIFILYSLPYAVGFSSYSSTTIFIIDYFESKGLTRSEAVTILLYMNFTSAICRLMVGIVKKVCHVNILLIPSISTLLGCICTASYTLIGSSFTMNVILGCFFFATQGCMITQLSMSTARLVNPEQFGVGMGILMSVTGVTNSASGPVIGYIRDVTGDYNIPLYVISGILCLSSIVFFLTMVFRYCTKPQTSNANTITVSFPSEKLKDDKYCEITKF